MKKKTLLSKIKFATVVVLTMVVLCFILNGCSITEKIEEEERLEEAIQEEEAKKEELSSKLEDIYLKYLEGNDEDFVQEFDTFLEDNFGEKERFLICLERQKIYNDNMYEKYLQEKEQEEANKEELRQEYLENRNNIYDYLTGEEIEILENCQEGIEKFYKYTLD